MAVAMQYPFQLQLLVRTVLLVASTVYFSTVVAALSCSWDDKLQQVDGRRRVMLDNGVNGTSEAEILRAFREDVTSDPNGALETWNTTFDPNFCSWLGVTCVSGRVSALNVSGQELAGEISPLLGSLTFLSSLDLNGNSFTGTIPPSLGLLKHLWYLDISNNYLTRNIPVAISNCSSLTHLKLSSNHLAGPVPSELGRLRNVSIIDLGINNLSFSIPNSLGNCSSLTYLDLSSNQLNGIIPYELGRLRRLSELRLSNNHLTGPFPKSITNCTLLEMLDLSMNQLSGEIVPEVGFLGNLKYLRLFFNNFGGPLPGSLGNLSSLIDLQLANNLEPGVMKLTGRIPPELGRLKNLEFCLIQFTNITGNIPPELGNLSNLTKLFLMGNNLTGTIQPALGNLSRLIVLDLEYNELVGKIPAWIGGLGNGYFGLLALRYNQLTGQIPVELGNLTKMDRLLLSYNRLNGPVISELGNLVSMRDLALGHNNFEGELPPALGNCTFLGQLFLSRNSLSGSIPPAMLVNLQRLFTFSFTRNRISGHIPFEIGALKSLRYINLSFNDLSGPIPASIRNCIDLRTLDFSNNHLTGELPLDSLEMLPGFNSFNISNNSLEGPIPEHGGAFVNISADDYAGNLGLCGVLLGRNCSSPKRACQAITCHLERRWIYIASGAAGLLLAAVILFGICLWKTSISRFGKEGAHGETDGDVDFSDLSLYTKELSLTIDDLWTATEGFSEQNILGLGGQSTVYKAVLPDHDGLIIAVKCLRLDENEARTAAHELYHELRVLGNLRHRNLVKLHGFCATPSLKALLIEFIPNGTLQMHLHQLEGTQSCQLSWETRLQIAIGVADAMVYLHHECHQPVIHRDLKPNNILLDADFNAKVTDFGIAKYVHQSRNGEASVSALYGTTGYIAPEYGTSNKVTLKGDVYSYGVVLLELLSGRRPTDDTVAKGGTRLADWVLKAFPHRIPDILDDTLNREFAGHEEQIHMLIRVGLLCTRDVAKDRPSMKDVRQMLVQVEDQSTTQGALLRYPTLRQLAHK